MNKIPEKYRDLLERPIVVSLATLLSDGTPQVQPVWCGYDGRHLLVNTEKGRQKYRNLSRRRLATVLAVDPADDTRWIEVRGRVVDETEDGADVHIDQLAQAYLGLDKYPYHQPGDVRVLFRIAPTCSQTTEPSRRERLVNWAEAPGARFCVCYGRARAPAAVVHELSIMNRMASMYLW